MQKTVALGLSGGVDSALAAWKLLQDGYRVIALTMSMWDGSVDMPVVEGRSGCFGPNEALGIADAKKLADRLGIEHVVVPVAKEFSEFVLQYFRDEYRSGRTPNPCVRCNQMIKFGAMLSVAKKMGIDFDYFATGHYARILDQGENFPILWRAFDTFKDQSYFLSRLSRDTFSKVIFPLGEMKKENVKALAEKMGWVELSVKKESQDFLECGDYSVLFNERDNCPGNFVDTSGKVLGQHRGIVHYTIGQRKGLNIGGQKEPLFVSAIDPKSNQVVLSPKSLLFSTKVFARNVNLLVSENSPLLHAPLLARIRLGHAGALAKIISLTPECLEIEFETPQFAATPGQIVVLYSEDGVVASAIIEKAE
jgi:tRNA-specific 2-thiouridylase